MPSFGRPISIFRCRWTPRPKGLKGVANWFYVQFQEEQDHARIFMNYILSRDAEVKLLPDRGGAHCLDFAAGDVPGHAGP